jgi:hypothetical protein
VLNRSLDRGRNKNRDTDYVVGTDKRTRPDVIPNSHYSVETLMVSTQVEIKFVSDLRNGGQSHSPQLLRIARIDQVALDWPDGRHSI